MEKNELGGDCPLVRLQKHLKRRSNIIKDNLSVEVKTVNTYDFDKRFICADFKLGDDMYYIDGSVMHQSWLMISRCFSNNIFF